jgi:histidinol-phosphate aminotransferase
MRITRRDVLWRLSAGAAAAAAMPTMGSAALRAESDGHAAASAGAAGRTIALDTNGNVYGPSPRTLAAVRDALPHVGRVSGRDVESLVDAIAAAHRVARDRVVVGCGASEILRMAAGAFAGPGKRVITARPTYDAMSRYAARQGAAIAATPLAADWSHDLTGMLAQCDSAASLVYICNPNNPTGSLTRRDDLERFFRRLPASVRVVIDEAYHDYVEPSSDYRSFIDQPVDDPRVVVVRSFSKIHGLAGLRVGYAIAAPEVAKALRERALDPGVNLIAARAAIAALGDAEHVQRSRRANADDRQEFLNQANARMLRCIDSQTNFVMMGTEHPVGTVVEQLRVDAIVDHFARHDIALAKPFLPLDQYVRVSLGTPAEMNEFWRVWELMPHRM